MFRPFAFFILAAGIMIGLLMPQTAAYGQFQQWTEPGTTTADIPDRHKELDEAVEEARWQLGALRLHPWISLHSVQYVDNIFSSGKDQEVGDITATLGAGLRGHVPLGENAFFAIHALPEYVWWQDLAERRRINGRYGVGAFAFFNRLALELVAARTEQQKVVTPEFEQLVNSRRDEIRALLDVDLVRSLGVHLAASHTEFKSLLDEEPGGQLPPLNLVDRNEEVVRAGLKLVLAGKLAIRAGAEHSAVEFKPGGLELSNSGTSPFLDLRLDGRTTFRLDLVYRDLKADGPTSRFQPFEGLTGDLRIGNTDESRIRLDTYASRNVVYSLSADSSYFLDTLYGARFGIGFGERVTFGTYIEFGDHAYSPGAGRSSRTDDVTSYGATLGFDLGLGTSLVLSATRTDYDSNQDLFDRQVTRAGFSFRLGEIGWP